MAASTRSWALVYARMRSSLLRGFPPAAAEGHEHMAEHAIDELTVAGALVEAVGARFARQVVLILSGGRHEEREAAIERDLSFGIALACSVAIQLGPLLVAGEVCVEAIEPEAGHVRAVALRPLADHLGPARDERLVGQPVSAVELAQAEACASSAKRSTSNESTVAFQVWLSPSLLSASQSFR